MPPLGRRAVLLRITVVVCLLAVAVLARNSGALREDASSTVPPMPGAAQVLPGVLRGAAPSDAELAQLRDSYRVRAIVAVGGASIEERAVIRSLDLELFEVDLPDDAPPEPGAVLELARFVRDKAQGQTVYVHDSGGDSRALITAASSLQVLDGVPVPNVLGGLAPEERAVLGPRQIAVLDAMASVADGSAAPDNPYLVLREVAR
jgi:hypothetical protein